MSTRLKIAAATSGSPTQNSSAPSGRGSFDMLGGVAAQIAMVKALVDAGVQLAGDLIVTFVADEEFVSIGTEDIVRHYSADAAIVTEPTGFGICTAHRGFAWFEVETLGLAAHGSQYEVGIDAMFIISTCCHLLPIITDLTLKCRSKN